MRPPSRLSRKLLLALAGAPLAVAALLLAAELACRALTPAGSALAPRRYFEARDGPTGRELVPGARPPLANARFHPPAIPIAKPAGTRRLLCVGDSTVHGHPFEPPAAFADWLAVRLPRLVEGARFEVWNLGVNGMNAEAVLDLVRELEPVAPDAVVVYVGHNEFLEGWLDACRRPLSHRVARLLGRSALGRRIESWRPAAAPPPGVPPAPGPSPAVADEPLLRPDELARGLAAFERNLAAIAREISAMGAVAVLCTPVSDVVDTPPERSAFAAATPAAAREEYRSALRLLHERRRKLEERSRGEPSADVAADARALLAEADALAAIDAGVAALHYEQGRLLRLLGDFEGARLAFFAARDRDDHPIRATAPMLERVRSVARRTGAVLVEPWPLFAQAAPEGLPGQDGFFVDYVHPDLAGHRLIADSILRALAARGVFAPLASWSFASEPALAEYEAAMGFSAQRQADSLARRGLFALGQSYLDPAATEPLRAAEDLFETALSVQPDCALARAGRGALALVRGDGAHALAEFERARELDPASLTVFLENYESLPAVRSLFDRAGLTVRAGRIERR